MLHSKIGKSKYELSVKLKDEIFPRKFFDIKHIQKCKNSVKIRKKGGLQSRTLSGYVCYIEFVDKT